MWQPYIADVQNIYCLSTHRLSIIMSSKKKTLEEIAVLDEQLIAN